MELIQRQLEANDLFIQMLAEQLKEARAKKKFLRESLKREKDRKKGVNVSAERRYADSYANRKLNRVGEVIPSRKKAP